jgi:hypothetical protein
MLATLGIVVLWYSGIIIVGTALIAAVSFIRTAATETPVLHSCHYCTKDVDPTSQWVKRLCPNCKEDTYFHRDCGLRLYMKQPLCNGVDMADPTGHVISLKYPNLCAHCGLAKEFWSEQHCSSNLPVTFTSKDIEWLRSIRISIENTPVEKQVKNFSNL